MGKISANPSELVGWAGWAQGLNGNLSGSAHDLNDAIEAFNKAPQNPKFTPPVAYVGNDVIAYAAQNGTVDAWVGEVGQAFAAVDHAGIPGGVYRANQRDFFGGVNTASEAALMALVGGDPTRQAKSAAGGARLAAEVREAQDSGDSAKVRALLARLENTDQQFDLTFFQDLGADRTITALIDVAGTRDQNLLRTFDTALGQATNDPRWDPAFTSALLDPNRGAWKPAEGFIGDFQLDLLRYGKYSGDFLTSAGDYFLLSGKCPTVRASDTAAVVFNALARNPDAGYQYLTGTYNDGSENLPRIQYLLRHSTMSYPDDGSNRALARLIDAAGFSGDGHIDGAGRLLQDIGSIPTANEVDDSLRPAIERLLAGYIGNFAGFDPQSNSATRQYNAGNFTWQERLFQIAELNGDGNPDPARMRQLDTAIVRWLATGLGSHPQNAAKVFQEAGALFGLALLPQRKALWNNYDEAAMRTQMASFLAGTLAAFLPGGAPVAILANTVITIASGYLGPSTSDTQVSDYDITRSSKAISTAMLITYLAARNPDVLPPSLRRQPIFQPGTHKLNPAAKPYLQALENYAMDPNANSFDGLGLSPSELASAQRWAKDIGNLSQGIQNYANVPPDAN